MYELSSELMAKPEQFEAPIPDYAGKLTANEEVYAMFREGDFSSSPPQGCQSLLSANMAGQNSLKDKGKSRKQ